jgi:hypothetical protein
VNRLFTTLSWLAGSPFTLIQSFTPSASASA